MAFKMVRGEKEKVKFIKPSDELKLCQVRTKIRLPKVNYPLFLVFI